MWLENVQCTADYRTCAWSLIEQEADGMLEEDRTMCVWRWETSEMCLLQCVCSRKYILFIYLYFVGYGISTPNGTIMQMSISPALQMQCVWLSKCVCVCGCVWLLLHRTLQAAAYRNLCFCFLLNRFSIFCWVLLVYYDETTAFKQLIYIECKYLFTGILSVTYWQTQLGGKLEIIQPLVCDGPEEARWSRSIICSQISQSCLQLYK